jgi:monofunctional biosynthetic peptidoglycan transglycosylase
MREGPIRRFTYLIGKLVLLALLIFVGLPVGTATLYRYVAPPVTPLMIIRYIGGEDLEKHWTPLGQISRHARYAVIAAEDNNFCVHDGFDWNAVREATIDYLEGDRLRGASTISMQTAKNVFLWPGRTFLRKGLEVPLTVLIEYLWDKQRILEVYLNVAEWGPGVYGIEAAAQTHFGKPAARLTRREAALLAAILPSPRKWSPTRPGEYVRARASQIERRMRHLGDLLNCARV